MTQEELKKMENSELLAHLFISRDNLIAIRHRMYETPNTEGLLELFDVERAKYDLLTLEVFRRMNYGKYNKKRH